MNVSLLLLFRVGNSSVEEVTLTLTGKIGTCLPQSGVQPTLCQLMAGSDTSQARQSRTFALSVTIAIASGALDLHQGLGLPQETHSAINMFRKIRWILFHSFRERFEEWPAPQFVQERLQMKSGILLV